MIIDLRSDTLTKPTKEMKEAMMSAPLGDDVFGEDPSVLALEEKVSKLFGMEAALFFPTGTMTNQVALGLQLSPGDQVLGAADNHVYRWEQGGVARHWGATYKEVHSKNPENSPGILEAEDFLPYLQPDDPHYLISRMISLENTLNFGGGLVYPIAKENEIKVFAKKHKLCLHLDGARIWNASVASNRSFEDLASEYDTVSVCLSKGLGCPVGSVLLLRQKELRKKAIRLRKVLGGGMRQVGLLAAAGLYALDHHIKRLREDHEAAKLFSKSLVQNEIFTLVYSVQTNMVWFRSSVDAHEVQKALEKSGLKVLALTKNLLRAVFHLDVNLEQVEKACDLIKNFKLR